jgi:hypothetical protein
VQKHCVSPRALVLPAALAALAVLASVPTAGAATPAAKPSPPLAISPAPGTPDASPSTQISILGVARDRIRSVSVTGSASGLHPGALRAYSAKRGASFVPRRPLDQGERVSVLVRIDGRTPVAFSFTVARLGPMPAVINIPTRQPAKLSHFVSRPDLLPPRITVYKGSGGAGGDVFLTPLASPTVHPQSKNPITIMPVGPGGPMIVDSRGNVVWFDQLPSPMVAANFRPQTFAGRQVLTWWQGLVTIDAFGIGEGVIADRSYRTVRTVRAGNGYPTDLHEFVLTPSGDALVTVYSPVLVHLPGTAPGALSPLLDSIVQEVDIRTGLVVWEWHALGHIPLASSSATPTNSADYDAFHINSIQPAPGDRVLVSARDTSAVYLVDRAGGRIVWTLGGKASSFRMGRGAHFHFQHHAQMVGSSEVSLFDDEAGPPSFASSSRGLILELDLRHRTASVVRQYRRPGSNTRAQSEGSVQQLPGGNVFLGSGSTGFFSEFSTSGKLLFDASLPKNDGSYREFRFPWCATPATRPAVATRDGSRSTDSVYVSWNGATSVARWQVLAGRNGASLSPVASAPASGFETRIEVASRASTFAVRALSSSGHILATSAAVPAS